MKTFPDNQRGAIAVISLMIIAGFALAVITTVSLTSINVFRNAGAGVDTDRTFYAAEAGINEGLYQLKTDTSPHQFCLSFDGVAVNCADSTIKNKVQVSITAYDNYNRTITSTAKDISGKERTLEIKATTSSISVPLQYAVHSGEGGFILDNGSKVDGPIYANGNITGDNTSVINGDVTIANVPTPSPKQDSHPLAYNIANSQQNIRAAQQIIPPVTEHLTKISLFINRTGNLPEATYYLNVVPDNAGIPDLSNLLVHQAISIPKNSTDFTTYTIISAPILTSGVPYWIVIGASTLVSSNHIIWNYNDDPNSYADGLAKYYNNTTASWVEIPGDFSFQTLLGIGDTFIKDGTVNGDVTAHSIININGTGARTSGVNPPRVDYPITDTDIAVWKSDAESGGELACGTGSGCTKDPVSGDVTISSNMSIGPNVIHGNLNINSAVDVTLLGDLYVEKNIIFNPPSGAKMKVGPALTPASRVVIAEGRIEIKNNAILNGSGHERSYLLLISKNDYLTSGETAIDPANNSSSVLYFAPKGFIEMAQNTFLNSAIGYIIHIKENATIQYNDKLLGFTVPDPTPEPIIIGPGQGWVEL